MDDEPLERRPDHAVEDKGRVHEKGESHYLEPLEGLPAKEQRDDPDEERSARVDGRPRRGTDASRYREAKEVKTARRYFVSTACLSLK